MFIKSSVVAASIVLAASIISVTLFAAETPLVATSAHPQAVHSTLPAVGSIIQKESDLCDMMKTLGYPRTEKFTPMFPSRVMEVTQAQDGIHFMVNGAKHSYPEKSWAGSRFVLVRLKPLSGTGESCFVFWTAGEALGRLPTPTPTQKSGHRAE